MKLWAHIRDGVVRGALYELPDDVVPGKDVFDAATAAEMVDVTEAKPTPADGWTTADQGKTFQPPVVVVPAPRPRTATTYALMTALTDAQRAAYPNIDGWDQRLFSARDTPWPEDDPQIIRMAGGLKTTPKAWFDAALGGGA